MSWRAARLRTAVSRQTRNLEETMDSSKMDDALDAIRQVRSPGDLEQSLRNLRDIYQVEHLAYCELPSLRMEVGRPYLVATYPDDWVNYYLDSGLFRNDPVLAVSRRSLLPVDWSTLDPQSAELRYIFAEAGRYGIGRQGISLPMRSPDNNAAIFTFVAGMAENEWAAFRKRYTGEIAILGQYFHDRVVRLRHEKRSREVRIPLSPRELECLQFLVKGLVPKQIAARLNLSEAAVRLYLKRARARLGAPSLMQAVIMAVRADLIDVH
jgi:DNA-binding CsgD family transcriptional regulator